MDLSLIIKYASVIPKMAATISQLVANVEMSTRSNAQKAEDVLQALRDSAGTLFPDNPTVAEINAMMDMAKPMIDLAVAFFNKTGTFDHGTPTPIPPPNHPPTPTAPPDNSAEIAKLKTQISALTSTLNGNPAPTGDALAQVQKKLATKSARLAALLGA